MRFPAWRPPLVFAVIAACVSASHADPVPFFNTVVDPGPGVGESASLVIDREGNPHISYYDATTGNLMYATRSGLTWTIETADPGELAGTQSSIAVDSNNEPRIAYILGITGGLRYIEKSAGVWGASIQVDGTTLFQYPSLALDADDNPRISYSQQPPNNDSKFAERNLGVWATQTITFTAGGRSDLEISEDGTPRLTLYRGGADTDVRLFERGLDGTWTNRGVSSIFVAAGEWNSLALDSRGHFFVSYFHQTSDQLMFAELLPDESINPVVIDVPIFNPVGMWNSIARSMNGDLHISYMGEELLKYARRENGNWDIQTVDPLRGTGSHTSIAVGPQGNPAIAYRDDNVGALKFSDSNVHVASPGGGEVWPVGAMRTVEWVGGGSVTLFLSTDGGQSYQSIGSGIHNHAIPIRVPHSPTRFARIRISREQSPQSVAESDSFFTIESSVSLLNFQVARATEGGGAIVQWNTSPGPEDLAGYRLDRREGDVWITIAALTQSTRFEDFSAAPGTRYRLYAVNGFGMEQLLGEAALAQTTALSAWPIPYAGGSLNISFATGSGLGGSNGRASVALYDVTGRLVRSLADGMFPAGIHDVTWDGRDAGGMRVPGGVYFVRSISAGEETKLKVVVVE